MNVENPLVSIAVITYNSSKYIRETLESIKNQSYKNIELIISDDCSNDSTLDVCSKYISDNLDVDFIKNAKIVSTDKNSGITPNYNNALKYITGTWIKYIAGDDMLSEDCIESYVAETMTSPDKLYVAGTYALVDGKVGTIRIPNAKLLKGNASQQFKSLAKNGTILEGPTIFVEKDTLLKLDGFSEKYPFLEDFPLFIKFTLNGYRIHLIEKPLIKYRIYLESVSNSDERMGKSLHAHYLDVVHPELLRKKMYLYYLHNSLILLLNDHVDDGSIWSFLPLRYCMKLFDPYAWVDFYLRRIKNEVPSRPYN